MHLSGVKIIFNTAELLNVINDSTYYLDSTAVHTLIDAAYSLNDGITTSVDFESYLKYVNNIYIEMLTTEDFVLSDEQREIISALAYSCPSINGPAVYEARAILAMEGNRHYFDDLELCMEEARYGSIEKMQEAQFLIFPIPTSNELHIILHQDFIKSVDIYSSIGQKISEHVYGNNSDQITISLQTYPPGIYQIQIKGESGKLYNNKFVIIK